jgi:flagellar M-ring protein FliF
VEPAAGLESSFSNLNEKDGGSIATVLEQQNIPHRYSDSGALLVPAERFTKCA